MSNQQSYKNQVVHLNLYKGTEILKKQDGTISNERQTVKLFHGSVNWANFLKNIKAMGFGIAEVGKVVEQETTVFEQEEGKKAIPNKVAYKDIETPTEITAEVARAMETNKAPELTADQKRIAELEAKLEAFMAGGKSEQKMVADPAALLWEQEFKELTDKLIELYPSAMGRPYTGDDSKLLGNPDAKRTEIARLELILSEKANKPNELEETELLLAARQKYMDLSGKQGDSRWGLKTLNDKIAELEAKQA